MRFGEKDVDFFFGHAVFAVPTLAQKPKEKLARLVQKPDQRCADHRKERHRRGHAHGDRLGVAERDLLGHEFAHDQADIGDRDDHAAHAQRCGPVGGYALFHQPQLQPEAQRRA
jgi:hypothetical protein